MWPRNLTSEYVSTGNEISTAKRYLVCHVHCSPIHINQDKESIWPSIDGLIVKKQTEERGFQHLGPIEVRKRNEEAFVEDPNFS